MSLPAKIPEQIAELGLGRGAFSGLTVVGLAGGTGLSW